MRFLYNLVAHIVQHPLARRRPLRTLARVLRWQLDSRLHPGPRPVRWIETARLVVDRGMTGATGNLYFGLHEFADMAFVLHLLRPGDLFVDVGANIGSYTVLAGKLAGAQVLAIEPHPDTADRLEANVVANAISGTVQVLRSALSDTPGMGALTADHDTMNHLIADAREDGASVAVPLTTLDLAIGDRHPVMLKIDVEGHEPAVFAGAAATLAKSSLLAIEIETIDDAIRAQLTAAGFVECFYDPFTRTLSRQRMGGGAWNRLFVRHFALVAERVTSARAFDIMGTTL